MDELDHEIVEAVDENGRHITRLVHYDPPATDMTLIATDELNQLRAEVARLRAGESDQPAAEGVRPTPAQWIRRWNDLTPERRHTWAEQIIADRADASRCMMADHDGAQAELAHVHGVLTRVRTVADAYAYGAVHAANAVDRAWGRQVLRDLSEALTGPAGRYVAVLLADLDLVMNHAGDPQRVAEYPAAAQRVRDALEGGQRG
ncbi:hypothetical protein ACBJ59_10800 [Nonomuraea sp. MTCD27]|uniref:hypothetical protein n=1 Tax=Nonomuraea sp. MTCD27 TaxID=1676747 RepID=UPI0035C235D4